MCVYIGLFLKLRLWQHLTIKFLITSLFFGRISFRARPVCENSTGIRCSAQWSPFVWRFSLSHLALDHLKTGLTALLGYLKLWTWLWPGNIVLLPHSCEGECLSERTEMFPIESLTHEFFWGAGKLGLPKALLQLQSYHQDVIHWLTEL